MPWNEGEYQKHYKNLFGLCRFTKNPEGGNLVTCDTYSRCDRCGWNPAVAKKRANKVRMERLKERFAMENGTIPDNKEKWFIGSGAYPK